MKSLEQAPDSGTSFRCHPAHSTKGLIWLQTSKKQSAGGQQSSDLSLAGIALDCIPTLLRVTHCELSPQKLWSESMLKERLNPSVKGPKES